MELLIRVIDKLPVVATAYEKASQRGDVIAIVPEGHQWSVVERSNSNWIIITVPDLTDEDAASLLEPGREDEPMWRRRLAINPDGLSSGDTLTRETLMARVS